MQKLKFKNLIHRCKLENDSLVKIKLCNKGAQIGGGEAFPAFFENQNKCPDFGKKCPDCVHP